MEDQEQKNQYPFLTLCIKICLPLSSGFLVQWQFWPDTLLRDTLPQQFGFVRQWIYTVNNIWKSLLGVSTAMAAWCICIPCTAVSYSWQQWVSEWVEFNAPLSIFSKYIISLNGFLLLRWRAGTKLSSKHMIAAVMWTMLVSANARSTTLLVLCFISC